jgi:hypothetical protein
MRRWVVTATLLVAWGTCAHAQSLGEAAAREKERRAKAAPKTGTSPKPFTEEDLHEAANKRAKEGSFPASGAPVPAPSGSPAASPKPAATPASASASPAAGEGQAGAGSATAASPSPAADDTAAAEEAKRARGAEYKARLAAANDALRAAEARLKRAEDDWNTVNTHESLAVMLPQATQKRDAARKEVAQLKQQRDGIEDEARREGIPPGYLR